MRIALRRAVPYLFLIVLVIGGAVIWLQRERLRDWWALRDYEPTVAVAQLALDTDMTPYGERLFYVNKPQLDDKTALNQNCSELSHEIAVLGCFRGDRMGIFIYDITDQRLYGIEQVTAAHEMLHQAYDRLSKAERQHVNGLLEDYYLHELTDQSVKEKIDGYRKTEPGELTNEMHSIFGSEIATLPAELEKYYARYFTDRQKVISFRVQSQAAYDEYFRQIAAFDAELDRLRPIIEASQADLNQQLDVINQKKAELEALLDADNIPGYNAGVPEVQRLVRVYNTQLTATNAQVEQYNNTLADRKAVAIQANQLNDALDSRLTPQ